jgi:cytochrome c oxidase subunit 2
VSLAVAATVAILLAFFFVDMSVERTLREPLAEHPLTIQVVGHQWWWEVRYTGAPQEHLTTANEIHIPTGRPVQLELTSSDVIHSVWVPSLAGKKDLIPGYKDTLWFQADVPGVYRGQCAEFCGHQHAKMGLLVIAEHPDSFALWQDRMRRPALPPTDSSASRGQEVFMTRQCVLCHNIEGTQAGSIAGPDLTHVASRLTLAAGSLENTRDNLARWIRDPQGVKPGAQMPQPELTSAELEALVAYLESLQ